jgi:hypothetical protein
MYSFGLVKKRRRRKIAAIFAIVGAIGVSVFAIVAFLGHQVGTFTVNLKNSGVSLTMFQTVEHEPEDETTYLSVNDLDSFTAAYSYKWFLNESKGYTFDKIHSEETSSNLGESSLGTGLGFFKYTFYIKNSGSIDATYDMDIELTENVKPKNGAASLDEYLRLMIFEADRSPVIYARRSKSRYDASHETYKEYVSGPEGTANYFGEAELFESDSVLATLTNTLKINEYRMYTLLFWLEGEDNECKDLPDEASLRIGATINAYPKQSQEAD